MRVSRYIKAHKDILVEYVYDDGNNLSEPYKILINARDNTNSFVSGDLSATSNTSANQLFSLDKVTNYYGIVNTSNYSFLQYKDFPSGFPIRFDTVKIHLPINYTFGEYIGCYVRVYSFDKTNKKEYSFTNFYYDQSDVALSNKPNFTVPPIKFQGKLWGKSLDIDIPSLYSVSRQMSGIAPKSNSLNANLTNGVGLSQNAPVFIDFSFITKKTKINGITTYYLSAPKKLSFPQTPDYENLGVKIEHSKNGDFFEIFGIYNGNIAEFKLFIDNSRLSGKRFYAEFDITLFEQNIRGKSFKITMTDNFNEKIEYRPIIKYTTTTAVIDVELRLVDAVDDSIIYRRASYGMLQDEVGKYSLNLTKINLSKAMKPKIYNLKNFNGFLGNGIQNALTVGGGTNQLQQPNPIFLEPIKIDRTVLVDKFNLIAKSENVNVGKNVFYGIGKLKIILQPFDNIVGFVIAKDVSTEQTPGINNLGNLAFVKAPQYLDMSNMGEISLVIKNDTLRFETGLYTESNAIDLTRGQLVFRIAEMSMKDIKRIFDSGQNVFYITSKLNSVTTSVYAGLYSIFDSAENIENINTQQIEVEKDVLSAEKSEVLLDRYSQNLATVYRRRAGTEVVANTGTTTTNNITSTSLPSTTLLDNVTYTITTNSSLTVDGYEWTTVQIKTVLNLNTNPTNLTFRTDSLFSEDKFLGRLVEIVDQLEAKYLTNPEDLVNYQQTQQNFNSGTQSGTQSTPG